MAERQTFDVPPEESGVRLDAFLARRAGVTRSQAEKLIREGRVSVNGSPGKPGLRLEPGMRVEAAVPAPLSPTGAPTPEPIPLAILFEDTHLLVVNKPPGLVVHPGAGRPSGTLVNALLAHAPGIRGGEAFRPGIVHRLDRDTSGILVVAKTPEAFAKLSDQVRTRTMERRYLALVWGRVREDRLLIDMPLARHPVARTRMAPAPGEGRRAVTDVRVEERFPHMTLVEARLDTGRTHQIRVHLASQGHPVVGDPTYGRRTAGRYEVELDTATRERVRELPGQALHAHALTFTHPATGQELTFSASPPPALARLLVHLHASVL